MGGPGWGARCRGQNRSALGHVGLGVETLLQPPLAGTCWIPTFVFPAVPASWVGALRTTPGTQSRCLSRVRPQ